MVLVCAAPGIGKSAFVLAYAVKSKASTLYFSADSDSATQLSRMLSIRFGWSMDDSKRAVSVSNLDDNEELGSIPIWFNYEASPRIEEMEDELMSYYELYEEFPELVVVDNITDVITGSSEEDPFAGLEALMGYLHKMARDTGACVVGLHHVTGPYNDGDKPIPLGGVKGQITRKPEMVLTLHRVENFGGSDHLNVSTVKNRAGRADPSGGNYATLEFIGDSMTIRDYT